VSVAQVQLAQDKGQIADSCKRDKEPSICTKRLEFRDIPTDA
jgi:hypothetical protein